MVRAALLSFVILAYVAVSCAQTKPDQPQQKNDLSHYSQAQLIACEDKPKLCGAQDLDQVDSELVERLPKLSTKTLVHCFADWHICGEAETSGNWGITHVLHDRGATDQVIQHFGHTSDSQTRGGIEHVAYLSKSSLAAIYMRTAFVNQLDDGENLYWPAMYLAKHCDTQALRYLDPGLNSKYIENKFSVSSLQFADTASLFGRCRYRPAIPFLIQKALGAASLNLVEAADESLRRFYPGTPPQFGSVEAEQKYFCNRANRNGFYLNCSDD